MSSTKIIHVLKNDNFEDVFDLFKNTEANEVIFVFPNGSKFVKQEQYFSAIKHEADSLNKRVSIMTADPVIARFASQNNLEFLETQKPKKRQTSSPDKPAAIFLAQNRDESTKTASIVQLIATREPVPNRIIKDIFKPEKEHLIKVKEEQAKPFEIEVNRELSEETVTGDITQVWASRENINNKTFNTAGGVKKVKSLGTFKKSPIFFIGGAVIVLLLILYSTLGSAQIIIKPQRQPLNFQIKASASSATTQVNLDFNRIPGQQFSYKDQESGTFEVTGQKDVVQKASGKITIYNKSVSSQRLVATTRFRSPDGLIFRIPQTINVPAAAGTGAVLKEGTIESIVYADKAGSEYNIGTTTFVIPGFEGTPKFGDFYAKSTQPMSGGIIGPAKVITEEDFTKAQEVVTAKLKERILRFLKDQANELKVLDPIVIKLEDSFANGKVGEAADNLQMTIKGMASTIAFRDSDVFGLVKNYVSKKGDLELLEKNLSISYLNPQNNIDNSSITFDVQITGQSAAKIDQDKILKDILGMREDAIRSYFKGIKEIESARIILSPFWIKNIPRNPSKIKLVIEKE